MEKLIEALINILKVRTIMTLMLGIEFIILCNKGVINGSDFMTVFNMILVFYFASKTESKK